MAKSRVQKQETLTELEHAFVGAKSVVFADYQGMNVPKVAQLRKDLTAAKVTYIVAKKTLLNRAAKQAGYEIDVRTLPGMLGIAVAAEDEMAAAKIIGDAGKEATIKLVGGIFDGKIVDQNYVITLSKLPTKPQLLAQLLSVFNGPMSGFARVLDGYRAKQEEGAPAPAAPEAAPAAEAPTAEETPAAPEAPAPEAPAASEEAPVEAPAAAPEAPAEESAS